MATWPVTLPQEPLQKGYGESYQNQTARTKMDIGPPKMRRRFTGRIDNFNVAFILTGTELAILETFFFTTLQGGSLRFDYAHPRTGVVKEFRFIEPYVIPAVLSGDLFQITAKLEVLP